MAKQSRYKISEAAELRGNQGFARDRMKRSKKTWTPTTATGWSSLTASRSDKNFTPRFRVLTKEQNTRANRSRKNWRERSKRLTSRRSRQLSSKTSRGSKTASAERFRAQ